MRKHLILLILLVSITLSASAQTLEQGRTALFKHEFDKAIDIFQKAAKEEKDLDDQVEAATREALVLYRIKGNFDQARKVLQECFNWSDSHPAALSAMSRLETAANNYEKAIAFGSKALDTATKDRDKSIARQAKTNAVLEWLRHTLFSGKSLAKKQLAVLEDTIPLLEKELEYNPGNQQVSRNLLDASLLLQRGKLAYRIWHIYYQLPENEEGKGVIQEAKRIFADALPLWKSDNDTPSLRTRIIIGLGISLLHDSAELLALSAPSKYEKNKLTEKFIRVSRFAREVKKQSEDYYQQTALGKEDVPGFYIELLERMVKLVNSREGNSPFKIDMEKIRKVGQPVINGYFDELEPILIDEYNILFTCGATSGYWDLHMGFILHDDKRVIKQYGKSAEITLNILEPMISNGFQSWAWNYESQHGGWAESDKIIMVNSSYTEYPVRIWKRLTDPEYIERDAKRLKQEEINDLKKAAQNPTSYLPGVAMRMRQQCWGGLKEELEKEGYKGNDLRTKFLAKVQEHLLESSIFAHEGRHVIDRIAGVNGSAELEFRAKLSEINFTSLPRRPLCSNIYSPNLGDPTGHGQANLRIIKGFVKWMENHKSEIEGYEESIPAIAQLDKLSDEQIKTIARSMDPLATPPGSDK